MYNKFFLVSAIILGFLSGLSGCAAAEFPCEEGYLGEDGNCYIFLADTGEEEPECEWEFSEPDNYPGDCPEHWGYVVRTTDVAIDGLQIWGYDHYVLEGGDGAICSVTYAISGTVVDNVTSFDWWQLRTEGTGDGEPCEEWSLEANTPYYLGLSDSILWVDDLEECGIRQVEGLGCTQM